MNADASLKDKCDYVGVDLPSGWGPVLMNGAASMGAATLSGKLANGTALTGLTGAVDAASVSRRSLKVKIKPTVDAKTNKSTPVYLVGGNTYTLTLANVPTPTAGKG